jgi:hypothetical protein
MTETASRNDRSSLLAILTELEVGYWHEVDHNWGRKADGFYVADGLFMIGKTEMRGREAVARFYSWRASRGERTARHVVTNFKLLESDGDRASFVCIMCLYAADGRPVLPSQPAIMIADIFSDCRRGDDGAWRFISHRLEPVFEGGVPATIPPV